MAKLGEIPMEELLADRKASLNDIYICQRCLNIGYTHSRDGLPVQDRLEDNEKIVSVIDAEIARRKGDPDGDEAGSARPLDGLGGAEGTGRGEDAAQAADPRPATAGT